MNVNSAFQIQVFMALLALIIFLTLVWFYFLQRYFNLVEGLDKKIFKELGSPDFTKARFPKESALLKHLFSDLEVKNEQLKLWHSRLRYFFCIYVLIFIMACTQIVLSGFL